MQTYTKGIEQMIKDRSHATSHAVWACHLYPVAVGMLPTAQGDTYKKFLILL